MKDMLYQKHGRLFVVARHGKDGRGEATWLCRCECGKEIIALGSNLRTGNTTSCGCFNKTKALIHGNAMGHKPSPEFLAWQHMKQRCENKKNKRYTNYGGRGIRVCDRWSNFQSFLDDMGAMPFARAQIDRIDVNGDYEKNNCRWVTNAQNSKNKNIQANNKCGFKGVCFVPARKKYIAQIGCDKKNIHLGYFGNAIDAARAYDAAAIKYHGEFASTNVDLGLLGVGA